MPVGSESKMKICQVTSVHPRYDVRVYQKIARSVARNGYSSCILVCDDLPDETKDGVDFYSVRYIAKNRISRVLNSSKKLYKKAIEIDADIYQLHDPELLGLGVRLKKAGKKVVFDSHEDYYYKMAEKAWIPKPFRKLVQSVYSKKEKKALKKFDGVISVTPHIVERLLKINVNTVMITNYPQKIDLPQKEKERIVCFAGGVNAIYNHDKIIEAVGALDNVKYVFAGVADEGYLNYLKTVPGYEKAEYLGVLPYEEVLNLYARSSMGIVIYGYTQSLGGKLGTIGVLKLFEYIQCNIPMVATNFDLWKPIVEGNKIGLCVNPDSVEQIRSAIDRLINDGVLNAECAKNCDMIKNEYCWDSQEKILLDFYNKILNQEKNNV